MADPAKVRKHAERVRELVASVVRTQIKDPRLGMITITDARITADLREATVFYTVLGDAEGILVNIFGGIMKCDVIAEGVVAAVREVGLRVPLVVRLEGTNVELGKEIIAKSNLDVTSADDLDDAAQKIVRAVRGSSAIS